MDGWNPTGGQAARPRAPAARRRTNHARVAAGALAGLVLALPGVAAAAEPPDAGRTIQELRGTPPTLPPTAPPRLAIEPPARPALADTAGIRLRVAGFRVVGSRSFAEDDLQALLQPAVGRELRLAELEAEATRITAHYRAHGYPFARAYLPAQDIRDGIVEIAVLEGRYERIGLDNRSPVADESLRGLLDGLQAGAVIEGAPLERSLLLLSDTPGVEVRSTLRPGSSVGTAELLVEALPGPRVYGALDADNYGNRFTGSNRFGATLHLANPAARGDLLSLRAMTAGDGLHYARLAYQLPVGPAGTRLGIAASDMRYRLQQDFAPLDAHGSARIGTVFLQHPLIRSRAANLQGQLSHDHKRLDDRIGATATATGKTLATWTLALNGDRRDDWLGGGITGATLAYTFGRLRFDSAAAALVDAATARSAGHFGKWTLGLTRLQRLTDSTRLYLAFSGQRAGRNLDSSEKFSLGGAYGVRAYPQGEASADEGQLATVELRQALSEGWQASAFLDAGRVRVDRHPWAAGTNVRQLEGAGVGLEWAGSGWNVAGLLAWKLGSAQPLSDRDRTPRLWLRATRLF